MVNSLTAVEITQRDDSLDIWVDANDNGVKDDDDVNIYVTASGGFYTISPTFKQALDATIQKRIKEVAIAILTEPESDSSHMQTLRDLSLALVLKATEATEVIASDPSDLAVEITTQEDSLDIWVDANNNGVKDDDDVNIYVTVSGGFYTVSPTFKYPLDTVLQKEIKLLATELLTNPHALTNGTESRLRKAALDLVLKATGLDQQQPTMQ